MLTRLGDACTVMTCKLVIVAVSWFDPRVGGVRYDFAILAVTPHTQVIEGDVATRVGAIYSLEFDTKPKKIFQDPLTLALTQYRKKNSNQMIVLVRRLGGLSERGWIDGELRS